MENQRNSHWDVIVVGAGPVGLTAALLLAEAKVKVAVVEKAEKPGDLPRAISLQDESLRILAPLGIAEPLKAESLCDTGSRYFGLNGLLLAEAKPVASRIGQPAKSQFDQPIMEELLFNKALEHPGLDFLLGHEVTGIQQDTEVVQLDIKNASGERVLTSNWVIAADGGRSFIRGALDIDLEGTTQPQRWIVVDLLNEQKARDPFAEFHCDGKRPYVLVPGIKGRLRIEFMLFDNEDADEMTTPEKIRELMLPFRAELDEKDVRRAAVYVAHQRVAKDYRKGRVFLVGDAAHLMPPFAGQGLNAGIRDASNAAWKVIEAVRGGASEKLLDSYGVERRAHGAKMMQLSQRIGAVVMATNPVATKLRDASFTLLKRVPQVHSYLANMRFISPPDYSDGVAISTDTAIEEAISVRVGRSLPQPQVKNAAGEETNLDAVLGTGWSVIGLGGDLTSLDPYFAELGATFVDLRDGKSSETTPALTDGVTVVEESAPLITASQPTEPLFIVVRPDKYVAAVFSPRNEGAVVDALRNFVDTRVRKVRPNLSTRTA